MNKYQYSYSPPNNEFNNSHYNPQGEHPVPDFRKKYEKAKLRWESNKLSFLVVIAIISMSIFASVLLIIQVMFSSDASILDINGNSASTQLSPSYLLINTICSIAGFLGAGWLYCKITKTNLNNILIFQKIKISNLILLVIIGLGVCMFANFATNLTAIGFGLFGIENNLNISGASDNILVNIIYVFAIAVEPALAEEFLFRGVILGSLRKYGNTIAVLGSSFLFAIMHGNITQIPFALIVGLALGYLTVLTNSMLPAILVHFFNNFYSVSLDIVQYNFSETTMNIIAYSTFIIIIILSIVCTVILAKKKDTILNVKIPSTNKDALTLSFKEKISCFILNPGTIICSCFFIYTALVYLKIS